MLNKRIVITLFSLTPMLCFGQKLEIPMTQTYLGTLANCKSARVGILACQIPEKLDLGFIAAPQVFWARQGAESNIELNGNFANTQGKLFLLVDGVEFPIDNAVGIQKFRLPAKPVGSDTNLVTLAMRSELGAATFAAPDSFRSEIVSLKLSADFSSLEAHQKELNVKKKLLVDNIDLSQQNLELAPALLSYISVSENLLSEVASSDVQSLYTNRQAFSDLIVKLATAPSGVLSSSERATAVLVSQSVNGLSDPSMYFDSSGKPITLLQRLCDLEATSKAAKARTCSEIEADVKALEFMGSDLEIAKKQADLKIRQAELADVEFQLTEIGLLLPAGAP